MSKTLSKGERSELFKYKLENFFISPSAQRRIEKKWVIINIVSVLKKCDSVQKI